MSLRDQLLKAGLVDKKKARKVNRELKSQRKQAQGSKESKQERQARQARERAERRERELAERQARQAEAEAAREAELRVRLLSSLVKTYQVHHRGGPQAFWHPSACGRFLHRLWLSESLAHDLRAGSLAVAWVGDDAADPDDYVLLRDRAALRIREVVPERVLFFNAEAPDATDPALELHPRNLPPSEPPYRARRVEGEVPGERPQSTSPRR